VCLFSHISQIPHTAVLLLLLLLIIDECNLYLPMYKPSSISADRQTSALKDEVDDIEKLIIT
jgi:hypothetical protein